MKCEGYKISGYDATYRKTLFNVNERGRDAKSRVLEVTDLESGTVFLIDLGDAESRKKGRIRTWKKD